MKKTALLGIAAVVFAACGPKANEVEIDALISNPETYNGQTVTFGGKAAVLDAAADAAKVKLAVYGTDSVKYIEVFADTSLTKCCRKKAAEGAEVSAAPAQTEGTEAPVYVDTAVKCASAAAPKCAKKGVKITGVVTACTQVAGRYYVVASSIEKGCCKKDGKKCCKKDSAPKCHSTEAPADAGAPVKTE